MAKEKPFELLDPFASVDLGIDRIGDVIKDWAISNREIIQPIKDFFNHVVVSTDHALNAIPPLVMLAILVLIAWQTAGRRMAILVGCCLVILDLLSPTSWGSAMTTLSIISISLAICLVIGMPLGILAGKNDYFETFLRPILDTMQTIPSFVYLVPAVMLIGIGNVSGIFVTIIFAMPPLIRLTSLGIREVDRDVVEAACAFGANPMRILLRVELPLAIPTIFAGINQAIMLSLSMVVVASMIAVKGLGNEVLRAMGRLDAGKAVVSGLGIVILAIVLDRITQGLGKSDRDRVRRHWYDTGPCSVVVRLFRRRFDFPIFGQSKV